ncbi:MAG: S10 family peptidase [Steroidobacteraceae bacterium]
MKRLIWAPALLCASLAATAHAQTSADASREHVKANAESALTEPFKPTAATTEGTVTIGGHAIAYQAVAGTLVVHPRGWDDVAKTPTAVASMFYVAYFKKGGGQRPITFFYNGGPGYSTMLLHMAGFGPRRVVTPDHEHTPPAPYTLVNNGSSLLDATDEVFIDAPGTGFSRIAGKDKAKAFYGVDADGYAFAAFITQFLSKYNRWNSPKYLAGESYGTIRSAVVINDLEAHRGVDFNGVILMSDIMNWNLFLDSASLNPGVDLPYALALPSYAATAWYHHKLPGNPPNFDALISDVERFAMGDYLRALEAGNDLSEADRAAIAQKLHEYTGLPVAYILKGNLRIDGGEFRHTLLGDEDMSIGRLDTRYSGPQGDPLGQRAGVLNDPTFTSLDSALISELNTYMHEVLHYGEGETYKPSIEVGWNFRHREPGEFFARPWMGTNVMPDLANAMRRNPDLKVMLNSGYFDVACPFYEQTYEMKHLPIPAQLQSNIEYHYYRSGHMIYAREKSLVRLHANVAAFIRRTSREGD